MSQIPGANSLTDWIYIKGGPNYDDSIRVRYANGSHQAEERIDGLWTRIYESSTGPSSDISGDSTLNLGQAFNIVDATSGPITITLPAAEEATGFLFRIKKKNETGNDITVVVSDGGTMDGEASQTLSGLHRPVAGFFSDGTEYHVF